MNMPRNRKRDESSTKENFDSFENAFFNSKIDFNIPIHKTRSKINKNEYIDESSISKQKKQYKHEAERFKNNTEQRKCLVNSTIWIIKLWLFAVVVLIFLCAFKQCELDKIVLCTLLGTTTVNVLGLGHIIIKGLFFAPESSKKPNKTNSWE